MKRVEIPPGSRRRVTFSNKFLKGYTKIKGVDLERVKRIIKDAIDNPGLGKQGVRHRERWSMPGRRSKGRLSIQPRRNLVHLLWPQGRSVRVTTRFFQ